MEILYAVINFLILAVIVVIIGRKSIVKKFEERRNRVNSELDEAESIENYVPDLSLPEIKVTSASDIAEPTKQEIRQKTDAELLSIAKDGENERLELRREFLFDVHNSAVDKIITNAQELLTKEPYLSSINKNEEQMVDAILSKIALLPGDIAYLKTHDILYVTLTSAFKLNESLVNKIQSATQKLLDEIGGKQSFWVKEDPSLIGGLKLRIGDTIYDTTIKEQLYQLKIRTNRDVILGDESVNVLVKEIEDSIKIDSFLQTYQIGRVLSVSDGICWMDGLADIMYGEVVEFECGERGMVLDIQRERIGCVIYGSYEHIESGSPVRRIGMIASVPVGEALLGRTVDAMGNAIDGKGRIQTTERRPIECDAPSILDRESVSQPLHTGLKAIDTLVPIGKGQRELIIGDRQTGKSSLAIDTIINQKGKNVICIYVAIGQKDATIAGMRAKLEKYDALSYTTIVSTPASASASLLYIAPFSATAMGEYFMYSGRDVLIIYDDLSKHAVAYRELSLLLHRPSGREAYPGDVFYLHSRLLERSAKLAKNMGGGSMTALPLLETLAGDIASYIPTNVISITDGQIFLETELFHEGQRPAVNVGLSVSRVGSAAQTKLMKQVSSSLRMRLAQYRELSGFAQFGTEMDRDTKSVLDLGARMMASLKQPRYSPLKDWQQALIIYAVSEGYANSVPVNSIEEYESELYKYFKLNAKELVEILETGEKMSDQTKELVNLELKKFIKDSKWQALNS